MLKNRRRRRALIALVASAILSGCSDDPVKQRIQELRRGDAPARRSAAQELGTMKDRRAVEALIAALRDKDNDIAATAVLALGRIEDPRAIQPLAAALKNPSTRWGAAQALVGMGEPAIDILVVALSDADVEISKALLPHLKQHEVRDPRLVEPLLAQLRSGDWLVRYSAAEWLGRIGDPRAIDVLVSALRDENRLVREEVARVLGDMGDARAVDALLDAVRDLNTAEAARALGKIGDPRALEPLAAAGWKPSTEREQVYLWICQSDDAALARARAQTCRVLLEDVKSKDKRRIDYAVFALVSLGWADMVPELMRILEEDGHQEMAETYLNCGQGELREAAKAWGDQHGYRITSYGGSHKTSWGAWR